MANFKQCVDHLGNVYNTVNDKCNKYKISVGTYSARLKMGWTEEEALTIPARCKRNIICYDHLGNTYTSIKNKCDKYCIDVHIYKNRISKGWTEERALTEPVGTASHQRKQCCDHLGNTYVSIVDKCNAYNITSTAYYARIYAGWPEEEALTTPIDGRSIIVDHIGNVYNTIKDKCNKYHISVHTYHSRLKMGWTEEEALTIPIEHKKRSKDVTDPFGNYFETNNQMCIHYHCSVSRYNKNMKITNNQFISLGLIPSLHPSGQIHGNKKDYHYFRPNFYINKLEYIGVNNKEHWSCVIDGQDMILSKEEIYKRMEEIVIAEYKSNSSVQTAES